MSDVVSPVVQSSSPEGLIPMDTDSGNRGHYLEELKKGVKVTSPPSTPNGWNMYSWEGLPVRISLLFLVCVWTETSAGLQRILQEIQPRDTNDFFTSARELNTERMDDRHSTRTPTLNTGQSEVPTRHTSHITSSDVGEHQERGGEGPEANMGAYSFSSQRSQI